MKIDFHTHTTASDGTMTPEEILKEAEKKDIQYFALSDHDTIDGVKGLKQIPQSINFITGVEISAEYPSTLHILGYGFNKDDAALNRALEELQQYRKNRNVIILEKMTKAGFNITMEELIAEAGGDLVGRPHFANLMLKKGYIETFQEAFDKYLKKGAPFYVDKRRFEPKDAVEKITAAGGIAVMAHPYQTKLDDDMLENLLKELCDYGLGGIEVYYHSHTSEMVGKYEALADKYALMKTAGSDFHGSIKPDIPLGMEVPVLKIEKFLTFASDKRLRV